MKIAITPNGAFAYVTNEGADNVSVISVATNTVVATIPVGSWPDGIAITPDGAYADVTNVFSPSVSIISTAINAVVDEIPAGGTPIDVAFTPDGAHAFVTNQQSATVTVINTATKAVESTVSVGDYPWGLDIATIHVAPIPRRPPPFGRFYGIAEKAWVEVCNGYVTVPVRQLKCGYSQSCRRAPAGDVSTTTLSR